MGREGAGRGRDGRDCLALTEPRRHRPGLPGAPASTQGWCCATFTRKARLLPQPEKELIVPSLCQLRYHWGTAESYSDGAGTLGKLVSRLAD